MLRLCVIAMLLAIAVAQSIPIEPHRQYATNVLGVEVIDFSSPALAYITDLRYDIIGGNTTYPRIWFSADKSSPNTYFAEFDPTKKIGGSEVLVGANHAFWATATSPFAPNTAAPFIAFDVEGGLLGGIAYANNYTQTQFNLTGFGPVVQGAYVSPDEQTVLIAQNQFPNYYFAAVDMDTNVVNFDGGSGRWVYTIGWASDTDNGNYGLVIARMLLGTPDPDMNFDITSNLIPSEKLNLGNCYDIFTQSFKPFVFNVPGNESYQIYVVPGRCSMIYKTVPKKGKGLVEADLYKLDPLDSETEYISSAALDDTNGILWFVVKRYQEENAYIRSMNVTSFTLTSENTTLALGESEPVIAVGNDASGGKIQRYVYVAASGGDRILRCSVKDDGTGVTSVSRAYLAPRFNQISSLLYVRPFLYFGTYEPNAQLGRVPKHSFCSQNCTVNSYCNVGVCTCITGYSFDPETKDENGNPACVLTKVIETQIRAVKETGAAAAIGIIWAFSLVAAVAGWYLWWKARAAAYSSL